MPVITDTKKQGEKKKLPGYLYILDGQLQTLSIMT